MNYLEQINANGSGRSKVAPYPIGDVLGISPGRHWIAAIAFVSARNRVKPIAVLVEGGAPRVLCGGYCIPEWSSNGNWLFVQVDFATHTSPGRSLAIPVGPGEKLPGFPPGGIKPGAEASDIPGAQSIARAYLVSGKDLSQFAHVNNTIHRNLYRISLR